MIRFGVIGTNRITESFLQAASTVNNFALTSVYSRSKEQAKEFAKKYNAMYTYTDLEMMVKSNNLDAVYIASPNSFHASQAILCMNNGKHVLCEKPIASNTVELKKMIAAAKTNNVALMEALKSSLMPNFKAVQENIHKIGKVRRYFSGFCRYSSRYDEYKEGIVLNAFNPVFSNGALMDIGVYCIYPLVVLFGKPNRILANGLLLDSGVDGEGSIVLSYDEMEAVIMYSKITNSYLPSEIQGEDGSILIKRINQPEYVEIRYRDESIEDLTQVQVQNTMMYEVQEFISLIKEGRIESATNSFENSQITMEIMDEVRKQIGLVFPADTILS